MKEGTALDKSKKGKAPPGLYATSIENQTSWMKSGVFPCEDAGDGRPYPFTYSESEDVLLPEDYRPTKYDVINGRGKKSYNHIANRRFRQLTAMNLRRYQSAKCKNDKTLVVIGIVNSIRKSSPSGGFIKRCAKTNRWISMSDEGAREKVGHCLRDMIASQRETLEKEKQQEQQQQQQQRKQRADHKIPNNSIMKNNIQETTSHLYASAAAAAAASASKGHALSALTAIANTLNQHNKKSASSHNQRGGKAATSSRRSSATSSKSPRKAANRFSSSRGKAYSAAAVAAATAATITIPPINGNDHQLGTTATTTTTHAPSAASAYPPTLLHPAAANAVAAASHFRHPGVFPHAMAEIQHIASTFNNFDYMAVTKSSGQEMSLQQRKILSLLEAGFKGSVEDLIRSVH